MLAVDEELLVLAGDLAVGASRHTRYGYAHLPAGYDRGAMSSRGGAVVLWHGPFGSPTGNLMLFRTIGGPLSTVYTEQDVDFSWQPEHRPILPPYLAAAGDRAWTGAPACY